MTILEILENSWRPALEIIILAVAIYYALMFVRGTRGWPVVVGFLSLLLVITLVTLLLANPIHRVLGSTGSNVLVRVMGLLLAALAAEQVEQVHRFEIRRFCLPDDV